MSDDQFTKLLAHLDKRLDEGFAQQRVDFERQLRDFKTNEDDKYAKLFRYLREEMATVHAEFKALEQKMDTVHSAIAVVAKEHETEQTERRVMYHQLDRHERWIEQLAQKLNVTLDYQEP